MISLFKRILNEFNSNTTSEATIVKNEESRKKVILYIDLKGIPEWTALNINENKIELILSDEYALDLSNLVFES